MNWKEHLIESFIEAISFSGSIALAIFIMYSITFRDLLKALQLGGIIWLLFFMVMFCSELMTGNLNSSEE